MRLQCTGVRPTRGQLKAFTVFTVTQLHNASSLNNPLRDVSFLCKYRHGGSWGVVDVQVVLSETAGKPRASLGGLEHEGLSQKSFSLLIASIHEKEERSLYIVQV